MTEGFLATVVSNNLDGTWTVLPKIYEHDGTPHPQITVKAETGLYPSPSDLVLVLTIKNNIDNSYVKRFYEASEANGRIIAIVTAPEGFNLKGNYNLTGNFMMIGNFTITENISVVGNISATGSISSSSSISAAGNISSLANITAAGNLAVTGAATVGSLTVGGVPYLTHVHSGVTPGSGTSGPVV